MDGTISPTPMNDKQELLYDIIVQFAQGMTKKEITTVLDLIIKTVDNNSTFQL
jgi:hypothetical protein